MTPDPILLQLQVQMPGHSPVALIAVIAGLAIVAAFFLINARRGQAGRVAARASGRFSKGRFRRTARQRGLSSADAKTLEELVLRYHPSAPMQIFRSTRSLDILLGKAIGELRKQTASETVRETKINTVYRIKQLLERSPVAGEEIRSTRQLLAGQPVSITAEDGLRCSSRVTGVLPNALAVQIPLDETGDQVRWKKWTTVEVFFALEDGEGFAFATKVLGYTVLKGVNSVLLQHTKSVSAAAQRKYRRRELGRPAYFYSVQITNVGTGRKATKKAVPQSKGALGTMLDVSAGGCAIKATFPLPKGSLIKVEFETERRRQVSVYGKVKRVRKAEPVGGIMHVMFTRISRKNLNQINSYVYDIG